VIVGQQFYGVRRQARRHVRKVRLPPEAPSVKRARDEVAAALRAMGWHDDSIDRARVVASELATNALLHAGTGFEVTIRIEDSAWIEVADGAPAALPQQRADPDDPRPGGMGLYLVDAMAEEWGVEQDLSGKVVWARLSGGDKPDAAGGPPSEAVPFSSPGR
jgi:anti-sigma regulatory factor (Ser/Thr protein kinase)